MTNKTMFWVYRDDESVSLYKSGAGHFKAHLDGYRGTMDYFMWLALFKVTLPNRRVRIMSFDCTVDEISP